MGTLKLVVSWLLRQGGLYVLLVLALVLGPVLIHAVRGAWEGDSLRRELMSPGEIRGELEGLKQDTARTLKAKQVEIATYPASAVKSRLRQVILPRKSGRG